MTPIQQFRTSARWSSLGILPSYLSCIRSANLRRTPEQRQGPGRGLQMVRPIIWSSSSGNSPGITSNPFMRSGALTASAAPNSSLLMAAAFVQFRSTEGYLGRGLRPTISSAKTKLLSDTVSDRLVDPAHCSAIHGPIGIR